MGWIASLIDGEILAVHAALLRTGHILYFGGSQDDEDNLNAAKAGDLKRVQATRLFDCNANTWEHDFPLAQPGLVRPQSPLAAVSRNSERLDVFWIRTDGGIGSIAWQAGERPGNAWEPPFPTTPPNRPGITRADSPLAAVSRTSTRLDVFWIGPDGGLGSTFWEAGAFPGNAWAPSDFPVARPGSARPRSPLAAVTRGQNRIDLFWIRPDGGIGGAFWQAGVNNNAWSQVVNITPPNRPGITRADSPIAAVCRTNQVVDVFWIGPDGGLGSTHWENGAWSPTDFPVARPGSARPGSPLAAVSRTPNRLDLLWIRPDGGLAGTGWELGLNNNQWEPAFPITPPNRPGITRADSPLAAVSRTSTRLDVFWIGPDGGLGSTFWEAGAFPGNAWAPSDFPLARPGVAAPGSGLAAVTRTPTRLDVFWVGSNLGIGSTAWEAGPFVLACPSPQPKPGESFYDLFCSGHAFLADGRLLVAGGIHDYAFGNAPPPHSHHGTGIRNTSAFDPGSRTWIRVGDMGSGPPRDADPALTGGRWYPTLLTLGTGEVLAMSGHPGPSDMRHQNNIPEIFSPSAGSWRQLSVCGDILAPDDLLKVNNYPRLHLLPDGKVLCTSPLFHDSAGTPIPKTYVYDLQPPPDPDPIDNSVDPRFFPDPRHLTALCDGPGNTDDRPYDNIFGTSVLLPVLPEDNYRARVLVAGGRTAVLLDLGAAQPTWTPVARSLTVERLFPNAVILPTGDVFVTGGAQRVRVDPGDRFCHDEPYEVGSVTIVDKGGVLQAELFSMATGRFDTLPGEAQVRRHYHGVALLMPDGRVWTAGSTRDRSPHADCGETRIEIYAPPYCDPGVVRPRITNSPDRIAVTRSFETTCTQASTIRHVALVRAGSATHGFNSDQRWVGLVFAPSGSDHLQVTAPPNTNIAPPGYYLLFVINAAGIPSEGIFVLVTA